jgi:hypothetical protein
LAIVRGTLRDGSVTVKGRTQHGQRFTSVRAVDEGAGVFRTVHTKEKANFFSTRVRL